MTLPIIPQEDNDVNDLLWATMGSFSSSQPCTSGEYSLNDGSLAPMCNCDFQSPVVEDGYYEPAEKFHQPPVDPCVLEGVIEC